LIFSSRAGTCCRHPLSPRYGALRAPERQRMFPAYASGRAVVSCAVLLTASGTDPGGVRTALDCFRDAAIRCAR
jgi:hypothetical protein